RLGAAQCPVLMFGDDVWRGGAAAEAVRLAELLHAPVFPSRQVFVNFPNRHPLYCGMYPVSKDFEKTTGLKPDLLFLVGCQGVHGAVTEPSVMQIGPNPVLMGRHYPLDLAAQCDVKTMLQESSTARTTLLPFGHGGMTWTRSGGGSLGFGVGAAIGAKIAVGRERPVVLHLGDGALGYSAMGFWTMARYKTAMLIVVSNNESYQIVRHTWANQVPCRKTVP